MRQTMQIFRSALVLLLVELLCWQVCFAQVDPWERIKLIEDGKKVSVKLQSGKTVNGKMEGWTLDGLGVRQGKDKVVPVAKSDVAQVALVTGMSRGRKAAWAGGITGGVVGGLFLAACASLGGCDSEEAAIAVIDTALFAGIAAGIAALFRQHKEVIYTAVSGKP